MSAFRSFKYRNFKLFFYGQSISLLGNWVQKTAVIWLVYQLTNSALLLGVVSFAGLIPSLLLSPYAGSFIERHDRFKAIKIIQRIGMLQSGILATVVFFHITHVWLIILLTLIQGINDAFEVTCRQSLMVEMVDDKSDLPNAIALNSTITNLARVIGPSIAGILLSTLGEDCCFFINFSSYIPVLIYLSKMNIDSKVIEKPPQNIWVGLKEGFDYITKDRELIGLILLLASSSLLVIPFTTLVPVFAKELFHGSSKTFSYFESSLGIGALISAVFMARLKKSDQLIGLTIGSSVLLGAGILLLAYAPTLPVALIAMMISGTGMVAQTSTINTYIQTHSHPTMRSRAISYFVMSYLGVIPIGSLLIGFFAEYLNVRILVTLEGIMAILAVSIYCIYRHRITPDNKNTLLINAGPGLN